MAKSSNEKTIKYTKIRIWEVKLYRRIVILYLNNER